MVLFVSSTGVVLFVSSTGVVLFVSWALSEVPFPGFSEVPFSASPDVPLPLPVPLLSPEVLSDPEPSPVVPPVVPFPVSESVLAPEPLPPLLTFVIVFAIPVALEEPDNPVAPAPAIAIALASPVAPLFSISLIPSPISTLPVPSVLGVGVVPAFSEYTALGFLVADA